MADYRRTHPTNEGHCLLVDPRMLIGGQNWANVENNPIDPAPEYLAYAAKRQQLVITHVSTLYRYRADLSYLSAQTMQTPR